MSAGRAFALGALGVALHAASCANSPSVDDEATGGSAGSAGSIAIDAGDAAGCVQDGRGDDDGDGFEEPRDCNDCSRLFNPTAFDFPDDGVDQDCSGAPDDEPTDCDGEPSIEEGDPLAAARALGLCRITERDTLGRSPHWGVLTARWVKPDGTPETEPRSRGLLPSFGVNRPLSGSRLVAISTGTARAPSQPGYENILGFKKGYQHGVPAGYPKEAPSCRGIETGAPWDGAALEIELVVPSNAEGMEVRENFFTLEFPGYVCSKFNDFFVVETTPKVVGYADGNIAFDAQGNPIGVNNSLLQVCKPQTVAGREYRCPLGVALLDGTGFDLAEDPFSPPPHAATGWLVSRAPVKPGTVMTIRFAIWDSADGNLDSTVLLDDFRWTTEAKYGTEPVPQ